MPVTVHSESSVLRMQICAETVSGIKCKKRVINDQFTTDALTDGLIVKLSDEKKTACHYDKGQTKACTVEFPLKLVLL